MQVFPFFSLPTIIIQLLAFQKIVLEKKIICLCSCKKKFYSMVLIWVERYRVQVFSYLHSRIQYFVFKIKTNINSYVKLCADSESGVKSWKNGTVFEIWPKNRSRTGFSLKHQYLSFEKSHKLVEYIKMKLIKCSLYLVENYDL